MKRSAGVVKTCVRCGKNAYRSERAAIGSALRCSGKRGTPLRVYYDRSCGCYHLTSKPLRQSVAA